MAERAPAASVAQRHRAILDLIAANGTMAVEALAGALNVTPQTVRRDLALLARDDKLARVHGGASGTGNIAWAERREIALGPKQAIGAAAAALIPDGASLFLDIGTTPEAVAAALTGRQGLLVVTNNLNAVDLLGDGAEVIVVGGRLRRGDRAIIGPQAAAFIAGFKVDMAVIGASAIDADGWLLDFDENEGAAMQAMIAQARRAILVVDGSKVGRAAPFRIAHLSAFAQVVTDAPGAPELLAACVEAGVEVVLA